MQPTMRGCKTSTSRFGPQPNDDSIRGLTLQLARLTRWGPEEILNFDFEDASWWLEGAVALEREINSS